MAATDVRSESFPMTGILQIAGGMGGLECAGGCLVELIPCENLRRRLKIVLDTGNSRVVWYPAEGGLSR